MASLYAARAVLGQQSSSTSAASVLVGRLSSSSSSISSRSSCHFVATTSGGAAGIGGRRRVSGGGSIIGRAGRPVTASFAATAPADGGFRYGNCRGASAVILPPTHDRYFSSSSSSNSGGGGGGGRQGGGGRGQGGRGNGRGGGGGRQRTPPGFGGRGRVGGDGGGGGGNKEAAGQQQQPPPPTTEPKKKSSPLNEMLARMNLDEPAPRRGRPGGGGASGRGGFRGSGGGFGSGGGGGRGGRGGSHDDGGGGAGAANRLAGRMGGGINAPPGAQQGSGGGGFRGPATAAVSIEHGDYDDDSDDEGEKEKMKAGKREWSIFEDDYGQKDEDDDTSSPPITGTDYELDNYDDDGAGHHDDDGDGEHVTEEEIKHGNAEKVLAKLLTQASKVDAKAAGGGDMKGFDRTKIDRLVLRMEQDYETKKAQWKERSSPRVRYQQLDGRGRAYGRGSRKTSGARVYLFPGEGNVTVNKMELHEYFKRYSHRADVLSPFVATKTCGKFDVIAFVKGGGLSGQAGAVRLGLSRALERFNPEFRMPLKVLGFLTRDPRMVERKKPGLKKARKAKQWVKR